MELPLNCQYCGSVNFVNFADLETRPVDKIVSEKGYSCKKCARWEAVLLTSTSFEESMRKLLSYDPSSKKFTFLLGKAIRKQASMRDRGERNGFLGKLFPV